MTSVVCRAGQTQIAKVLQHAINETQRQRVTALVFVGDCMEENVDRLAHQAGQLGMLKVPAFMFHEGADTAAAFAFKEIARLSGGAYCRFDSSSPSQLRDLLRAVAVYAAGGRQALQQLATRQGGEIRLLAGQLRGSLKRGLWLLLGLALLLVLGLIVRGFVSADPRQVMLIGRWLLVGLGAVVLVFFALSGRLSFVIGAIVLLLPFIRRILRGLDLGHAFGSLGGDRRRCIRAGDQVAENVAGSRKRATSMAKC